MTAAHASGKVRGCVGAAFPVERLVSPLWSNNSNAYVSGSRIFAGDFEAH
jgi:AMMECR1 domain-containing protein